MVQQASAAPFNTVIDTCAQTNLYCLCNACDGNNWLMKYYEQAYLQAKLKGHVFCIKRTEKILRVINELCAKL